MTISGEQVATGALLITAGAIIFKAGRLEAKMRETQAATKKDIDGIGTKQRRMMAEQIIAAKARQDFEYIVRRLLG